MTDPLDDLKSAFDRATPAPDPARKADILARAQENFDRAQGSAADPRPTPDRPRLAAGFRNGVGHMLSTLSSRGALAAGTAIVAVGVVMLLPVLQQSGPPMPFPAVMDEAAPPPPLVTVEERAEDDTLAPMAEIAASPEPVPMPMADAGSGLSRSAPVAGTLSLSTAAEAPMMRPMPAPPPDMIAPEAPDTEAFANEDPNPVRITAEEPVSTFSVDVDTASWSILRSSLMAGRLPPADAVRIEEMVNYFPYAYPAPEPGTDPFRATVTLTQTPWNPDTQLLRIGLQGEMPALDDRPPLNLVFLVDTSGSMQDPDKLPLLKQSFRLMLAELRPEDQVAIVAYAGSAGRVLDPTPASDRATILAALDRLQAGGSTAGQEGLELAYATAEAMAEDGQIGRVILATDGDFNVGLSDPGALEDYIADKRDSGTYLSVLGFGRGNLDDATMQALAQAGNGQAAYIDTLAEARKVLVDQLTGALFPIAGDVKVQVEFNPATVAEYRLIGYETRALRREDFNNDRVDAGDIGAGHTVTALYEITPPGSPAILNDPLRYGDAARAVGTADEIGFLRLRYKAPGADDSRLIETPIGTDTADPDADLRFAAAIAGFGQLLRGGDYLGDWSWSDAIALAEGAQGDDRFGYRREAITLMRLAESLSR